MSGKASTLDIWRFGAVQLGPIARAFTESTAQHVSHCKAPVTIHGQIIGLYSLPLVNCLRLQSLQLAKLA